MYKKVKESQYTYRYKCSVVDWLGALEGNENFREDLIKHGDQVRERLSRPESQTIRQLVVNFDLIEVKDGWCFRLIQKYSFKMPLNRVNLGKSLLEPLWSTTISTDQIRATLNKFYRTA